MSLLWSIFLAFAKVGLFGFGGGQSMMPLVQDEIVNVHCWMTNQEFVDALALGNALPGPIATKMAVHIGYRLAGLRGAAAGLLGIVTPSLVLILALTALFLRYQHLPHISSALRAVRPVVVALLLVTAYTVFPACIVSWDTGVIMIIAFLAVALLKVHPALIILAAAAMGLIVY